MAETIVLLIALFVMFLAFLKKNSLGVDLVYSDDRVKMYVVWQLVFYFCAGIGCKSLLIKIVNVIIGG